MNEFLKDRILRRLETLPDERLYQVLDYIEFLESKYAQRQAPQNVFTRFAEGVEDTLRAGKVSASAISETMNLMNKAMGVLGGVAAAGRSVASDIVGAARTTGAPGTVPAPGTSPAPVATPASPPSPAAAGTTSTGTTATGATPPRAPDSTGGSTT
jgi:hypothetical protein